MAVDRRDDEEERTARIDMILEELRLNSEDLKELMEQARERAAKMRVHNRALRERAHAHHKKR